jgi:hypothetical protein
MDPILGSVMLSIPVVTADLNYSPNQGSILLRIAENTLGKVFNISINSYTWVG